MGEEFVKRTQETTMVIKTETCYFSESKIYPGHGRRYVARDGKYYAFLNQKVRSLFLQKIRAQKLTWTQAWRRKNKKGRAGVVGRKKRAKTTKVVRGITGITIDDLKKKKSQKPEMRKALRETQIREMKERKKKTREEKKKNAANFKGAPSKAIQKGRGKR